jgi:hypothetical protein
VIDAAGQARWFQFGVELVEIRYDEAIDVCARRKSRFGRKVEWRTDKQCQAQLPQCIVARGVRCERGR